MSRIASSRDHFYGVILAGGSGTRFWPRSRAALPKQFLAVGGEQSLLRRTFDRLQPLVSPKKIWVLTNETIRRQVIRQLPEVPRRQVIAEPTQRNTAPAIALAAKLLLEEDPDAVMGIFPSDHLIQKTRYFPTVIRQACNAAKGGRLIVLGIKPTRPETGFGYIEFASSGLPRRRTALPVVGFREKPKLTDARRYYKTANFFWNSGMFVWQAQAFQHTVEQLLPRTAEELSHLPPLRSRQFQVSLSAHYPNCDSISVDHGILERASNIFGIACPDLGWNDIGSWEAVYELGASGDGENVARSPIRTLMSEGNFVDVPGKLTALVGVKDLAVVETPDALLICDRHKAQRVADLVRDLKSSDLDHLV
jgi:mannose-1-phosphate guanylyltransferase